MPSTTTYHPGDLLLMGFPFSGGSRAKTRPAMVLLDSGDQDVVVARITTQQYQTQFDVTLTEWSASGLLAASIVRLHKIATLEKSLIRRKLGTLGSTDRLRIAAVLQQSFGSW